LGLGKTREQRSGGNYITKIFMISNPHQISVKLSRMRCEEHVTGMGEMILAYRILGEKLEEKERCGRPRRRWKNYVKIDFIEMGWETWAGLIWLRTEAGNKPPGSINRKDIFDYLKADRLLWNDSVPVSPLK
jgi:hypothetical protein